MWLQFWRVMYLFIAITHNSTKSGGVLSVWFQMDLCKILRIRIKNILKNQIHKKQQRKNVQRTQFPKFKSWSDFWQVDISLKSIKQSIIKKK